MVVWASLSASLGTPSNAFAQSSHPRVREIPWDPLTPIARRLLPDDEVVIIRPFDGDDVITPGYKLTVHDVIEDVALRSDIVAVIDVEAVNGVLLFLDSSIRTRITGIARDVLRVSRNHRLVRGQHIEAHLSFGTAMVEHVLVRDGRWQHPAQVHPGSRCLLFLRDAAEGMLLDEYLPLIVKNGRVSYTKPYPEGNAYWPAHPMQGLTVSDVAQVVQHAKTSWICGSCDTADRCHVYCGPIVGQ